MPEIGEGDLRKDFLTLNVVKAQHDENVFGKVGTSASEFEKALNGKEVVDAKQQGKYFWLVMASPPHPLFHFGMAGWWKIRDLETAYYKPSKPDPDTWPPKYWKFTLETDSPNPKHHAFVDYRRFARIRLIDCPAGEMRNVSPLKENGPDPVVDKDILTEEWLVQKLQSKRIPVKALLLDQANISGIGNWVGDELLYDAKMHPEQYSNTLTPTQMKQLHKSIHYVCSTAVELRAESDRFPEHWLFKHRWGKGKKEDPKCLPNGGKIKFVTVGGRTSAIVPSVQKKMGEVAKDIVGEDGEEKPKRKKDKKSEVKEEDDGEKAADGEVEKRKRRRGKKDVEDEDEEARSDDKPSKAARGRKHAVKEEAKDGARPGQPNGTSSGIKAELPERKKVKGKPNEGSERTPQAPWMQKVARPAATTEVKEETSGRRRSARVSGAAK